MSNKGSNYPCHSHFVEFQPTTQILIAIATNNTKSTTTKHEPLPDRSSFTPEKLFPKTSNQHKQSA